MTPRYLGRGAWIGYYADRGGYSVTVYDPESIEVFRYDAGNHPGDSQIYLPADSKERLPLRTIQKFARQTAEEMAAEWSIDLPMVHDESGE